MTPAEWVSLSEMIGKQGLPTIAAAIMMGIVIWQLKRSAITQDTLLDRILHGNGNGAPSLQRIDERMDTFEHQQRTNTGQIVGIRDDLQKLASAWEQCRKTPGCPQQEAD